MSLITKLGLASIILSFAVLIIGLWPHDGPKIGKGMWF